MAGEAYTTLVGNLTADPELRYTQNGVPVCGFTIAVNERKFDRTSGEFVDADPLFMRCSVWREPAEHVAGSLFKGNRVMVYGKLRQRSYQDREGNDRTVVEVEVEEIGASLRYATAVITRAGSGGGNGQGGPAAAAEGDAWASTGSTDAAW